MLSDLVRRAQSGDTEAFSELVARTRSAAYGAAYGIVFDRDAAMDIAQDAFVYAFEHLSGLQEPRAYPGWIVRICRNLAVSWLRSRERDAVPLDEVHAAVRDMAEGVLEREEVNAALAALPEANREALVLALVNGYTYEEVADLTGSSPSTVKGRIQRARRQIATEVLGMVETTLKADAPDEGFDRAAILRAINDGYAAFSALRLNDARAAGDSVMAMLEESRIEGSEAVAYAQHGWGLRLRAEELDHAGWRRAAREQLAHAERIGDPGFLADALWTIAQADRELPHPERDAMTERAIALWRESGRNEQAVRILLRHGGRTFSAGDVPRAEGLFAEVRALVAELSEEPWQAAVGALDMFVDLLGGSLRREGCCEWVVRSTGWRHIWESGEIVKDGGEGAFWQQEGDGASAEVTVDGFDLAVELRRVPLHDHSFVTTYEERRIVPTGIRCGTYETHSRVSPEAVVTPAGTFEECLHTTHRRTLEGCHLDREPYRERLLEHCGLHECWYARGVGPVRYRFEGATGGQVERVLSRFETNSTSHSGWADLWPGATWEYVPGEPHPTLDVRNRVRVVSRSADGHRIWLAHVGLARER